MLPLLHVQSRQLLCCNSGQCMPEVTLWTCGCVLSPLVCRQLQGTLLGTAV